MSYKGYASRIELDPQDREEMFRYCLGRMPPRYLLTYPTRLARTLAFAVTKPRFE